MRFINSLLKYMLILFVLLIFIGPMIWVAINSFKSTPELLGKLTIIPETFTLEHYQRLLSKSNFIRYFFNSVIVAVIAATITAVIGAFGAYSIFRCKYPGRRLLLRFFISSYALPKVLLLVPLYIMLAKLNVIDTVIGVVTVHVMLVAPFSVWILRGFFQTVPVEIEEAALIDGCNKFQTIFKIFIPLAAPGIAAIWLNAFLMSWSEYLFASILIISEPVKTLPVGLAYFLQEYSIEWGVMMAASVLVAVPAIVGFAFAGKYFIQGLTAGGVKG